MVSLLLHWNHLLSRHNIPDTTDWRHLPWMFVFGRVSTPVSRHDEYPGILFFRDIRCLYLALKRNRQCLHYILYVPFRILRHGWYILLPILKRRKAFFGSRHTHCYSALQSESIHPLNFPPKYRLGYTCRIHPPDCFHSQGAFGLLFSRTRGLSEDLPTQQS